MANNIVNKTGDQNYFSPKTGQPYTTLSNSKDFVPTMKPDPNLITIVMHNGSSEYASSGHGGVIQLNHRNIDNRNYEVRLGRDFGTTKGSSFRSVTGVSIATDNVVKYTLAAHGFKVGDVVNVKNGYKATLDGKEYYDTYLSGFQKVLDVTESTFTTDIDPDKTGLRGNTTMITVAKCIPTVYKPWGESRSGLIFRGMVNTIQGEKSDLMLSPGAALYVDGKNASDKNPRTSRLTVEREWELVSVKSPYLAKVKSVKVFKEDYGTDKAFDPKTNHFVYRTGGSLPEVHALYDNPYDGPESE